MFLLIVGCVITCIAGLLLAPFGSGPVPDLEAHRRNAAERTPGRRAAGIGLLLIGLAIVVVGVMSDPGSGDCTADGRCTTNHGIPLHLPNN
jgi:ferric-dicitrate binding protein FerR (iron transport regulator)